MTPGLRTVISLVRRSFLSLRSPSSTFKSTSSHGAPDCQLRSRPGKEDPSCPRLIVNDATVEKLGELLNENPNGLLLTRDELAGFLARIESEEYQSERAFYLEAFSGDGKYTCDRIGRGTIHIEHCILSLIGGIQPTKLAPLVRAALGGTNNDGLVQRLQLAVWPDDIGSWS